MDERFAPKVEKATKDIDGKYFYQCDTTKPDEIKALAKSLEKDLGKIDFIVHSIAFADKEGLSGNYYDVSKEAFLKKLRNICLFFGRNYKRVKTFIERK